MKFIRVIFTALILFTSSPAHSFSIQLNEPQINGLMAAYFPVAFSYEQADIQLTNASITVKGNTRRLQVNADIKATQANDFVQGTVAIDGEIAYDKNTHKLHIIEPRLIHANINDSSFKKQDINSWLQKAFNQALPVIVLLDFKKLNFQGLTIQPNRIEVLENSVLIEI